MYYQNKTKEELIKELQELQREQNSLLAKYQEDIIERERAENSINQKEQSFKEIIDLAPDAFFQGDTKGNFIEVNQKAIALTGFSRNELLKMNMKDLFPSTELNNRPLRYDLLEKGEIITNERDILTKTGTRIIVEMNSRKMPNGTFQSSFRDISDRKRAEQALKLSEEKFRKAFIISPDSININRVEDGMYISINKGFTQIMGYTEEDVIGKTSLELDIWANPEDRKRLVFELKNKGYFNNLEAIFRTKSGKLVNGLMSAAIIELDGIPHILSTTRDISERKQTEEKIRKIGAHYQALIEKAPDGIVLLDAQGQFKFLSPSAKKMFGYSASEELTDDPSELTHPEDLQLVLSELNKLLEDSSYIPTLQYRFIDKNGNWKWVESTFSNLLTDPSVESIVINFRDITERKHAEMLLQEKNNEIESQNEEYQQINEELIQTNEELSITIERAETTANLLQNISDNIPAFIAVVDSQTLKYTFVNHKFTVSFNKKREEIIGAHISEIIGDANTEFAMPYIEEVRQGRTSSYINTFSLSEGKRYINVSYVPGYNSDGRVDKIVVLSSDITAIKESELELLKAKEKAEESDRLKTAFLQNMSHEIRTPMNAIMGFSSLLVEQYNNRENLEKFSEIINQRCNDLLDIINDILDIARIESGQLQVNLEECYLNALFAELTTFFSEHQKRLGKQHIKFSLQAYTNSSDIVVAIDKIKLKQIFINLISNAFKFTDEGFIEGGCKFDENQNLIFYLSDSGIGIPAEKQDEVFERFTQLNHGIKRIYGGTGLGLSIVKGLVTLMGGKIKIESECEKGTTFYFSIPCEVLHSIKKEEEESIDLEFYFPNKTILVVEDDIYNLAFILAALDHSGLQILKAENGIDAVQMALSQNIDLVLMDIRLPDIDGYEATRQILQLKPRMKIIAQTAYASSEDKRRAENAGCLDYISKPIKKQQLLSLLSLHLTKSKK